MHKKTLTKLYCLQEIRRNIKKSLKVVYIFQFNNTDQFNFIVFLTYHHDNQEVEGAVIHDDLFLQALCVM